MVVDDTPSAAGGQQHIKTPEGHVIPLSIRNGLAYMDMQPPTKADLDSYPHVMFTCDDPWNPSILDDEYHPSDEDYYSLPSLDPRVNEYGEILHRDSEINFANFYEHEVPDMDAYTDACLREAKHAVKVTTKQHDYE